MRVSPTVAGRPVLVLVLVAVLASSTSCTKKESLVLLDLRVSGPLGAPVASVRLSAPGGKTRTITGAIGPEGFRVGYYGPSDDGTLSVTAEALDGVGCVLGRGSATVTGLESGTTSAPTTLFIRPLPASGCEVVDAGGGNQDAGGDTGSADAGTDTPTTDAGATDTPAETAAADAGTDALDAGATDAPATDAAATDAPATDAATTDTPATDAATTDTPATDAAVTDTPAETSPADADSDAGDAPSDASDDGVTTDASAD